MLVKPRLCSYKPLDGPIDSAADSNSGGSRSRKGGARRYKTPSPQLLRCRREQANARERKRMNSLNTAFDQVEDHNLLLTN